MQIEAEEVQVSNPFIARSVAEAFTQASADGRRIRADWNVVPGYDLFQRMDETIVAMASCRAIDIKFTVDIELWASAKGASRHQLHGRGCKIVRRTDSQLTVVVLWAIPSMKYAGRSPCGTSNSAASMAAVN